MRANILGCSEELSTNDNYPLPPGLTLEEILLEEGLAEMKDYGIVPKKQH